MLLNKLSLKIEAYKQVRNFGISLVGNTVNYTCKLTNNELVKCYNNKSRSGK